MKTCPPGTANALTTRLMVSRSSFLDTIATGYVGIVFTNSTVAGDWIKLAFTKTNGSPVSLGVTNTSGAMSLAQMAQALLDKMLAKRPDERFQSAAELCAALGQ